MPCNRTPSRQDIGRGLETQGKRRALPEFTVDFDVGTVLFDDSEYDGKAETGSALILTCREEGLENAGQVFFVDSLTRVLEPDAYRLSVAFEMEVDRTAAFHRLEGVDEQVEEDLFDFSDIAQNANRFLVVGVNPGDDIAPFEQVVHEVDSLIDEIDEVDLARLFIAAVVSSEVEQASDDT